MLEWDETAVDESLADMTNGRTERGMGSWSAAATFSQSAYGGKRSVHISRSAS